MNKPLAFISIVALSAIVMMMFLMSPSEAGPLGIFIFFVLCYAFFLGLAVHICKLFFVLLNKAKKGQIGGIDRRSFRYGMALAIAPELAVILKSGGSLGVVQLILIAVFEFILFFFISHTRV